MGQFYVMQDTSIVFIHSSNQPSKGSTTSLFPSFKNEAVFCHAQDTSIVFIHSFIQATNPVKDRPHYCFPPSNIRQFYAMIAYTQFSAQHHSSRYIMMAMHVSRISNIRNISFVQCAASLLRKTISKPSS
jgi:hypothetical protein